jgi:CRP-like cAMP-binding protein
MAQTPALRTGENQILAALPTEELRAALPIMELVRLEMRQTVYENGRRITHVYFPLTAMLSMITVLKDGSRVEAATIGNEGMTGLPLSIPGSISPILMVTQIAGECIRIPADAFRGWLDKSPGARELMDRHAQALLALVAQTAACNRLHSVEQRCARWLLLTHDRVREDTFPITQELLSTMLGVRRASVNEAAATLQRHGLIKYHRGSMTILDRDGLAALACECYEAARQHQLAITRPTR